VRDLPPPLPPAERTVGQLVGETIRAYGQNFLRLIPLGIPLGVVDQLNVHEPATTQALVYWAAGPFVVASYLLACSAVHRVRPTWTAYLVGLIVYLPFPALRALFILPGIAWFALFGLAVPASLVETLGVRDALERGRRLGLADYLHAIGSLAALVVVVGIAEITLSALLHTQGGSSARAALFLADLVLTPLLFLGGALLYDDQVARVGSPRPHRRSRRDADVHPPLDPDAAGRADPEGQS
jgi:hypothetical protein